MTKISASVDVHVPVESVGAFLDDWHGFPQWNLGVCDFRPTTEQTTGEGARYAWRERILGREVEYEAEVYDWMPNRGSKWRILKGPKVIYQFELELTASGTRVTETVAYDTPPVSGGLPDPSFLRPVVIQRLEISLKHLKGILEGERPAEP